MKTNRRAFLKQALWVPPLFAIGRAKGQALTLADSAFVGSLNQAAASSAYTANATRFDSATPDYLVQSGDPGFSDSKQGIISFWVKFTGTDGVANRLFLRGNTDLILQRLATNAIRFTSYNGDGATLALNITTTATITADGNWHHVLISWDTATVGSCWCAVDGSEGTTVNTRNDVTCDYTFSSWYVSFTSNPFDGDISEFYFAPGQSLGSFSSANVQKFRTTGGKPVDLGSTGATPTGSQPGFYLRNAYSSFGTNSGTGGNLSVSGTLQEATAP